MYSKGSATGRIISARVHQSSCEARAAALGAARILLERRLIVLVGSIGGDDWARAVGLRLEERFNVAGDAAGHTAVGIPCARDAVAADEEHVEVPLDGARIGRRAHPKPLPDGVRLRAVDFDLFEQMEAEGVLGTDARLDLLGPLGLLR